MLPREVTPLSLGAPHPIAHLRPCVKWGGGCAPGEKGGPAPGMRQVTPRAPRGEPPHAVLPPPPNATEEDNHLGWFCVEDDGNQVKKDRHPLLLGHMPVTVAKQQECKVRPVFGQLGGPASSGGGGGGSSPHSGSERRAGGRVQCWRAGSLVSAVTPALGSVSGSTWGPLV